MSDLISREDAIEAFDLSEKTRKYGGDHSGYDTMLKYEIQDVLENLPSAEAVHIEVYRELYEKYVELKHASAEDEWIPCNKQMPDELAAVNITWVNHNPPPYYKYTKDVPLVDSAVYYRGKWYWWDATVIDLLGEYDGAYIHGIEPIDKDIEVVAWMPFPKPYREDDDA